MIPGDMTLREALIDALTAWPMFWKAPECGICDELIDEWEETMESESINAIEFTAAAKLMKNSCEFWPKPFQVIAKVEQLRKRVWQNALANHVLAIDANGKEVLAHKSRVQNGRVLGPGETRAALPPRSAQALPESPMQPGDRLAILKEMKPEAAFNLIRWIKDQGGMTAEELQYARELKARIETEKEADEAARIKRGQESINRVKARMGKGTRK